MLRIINFILLITIGAGIFLAVDDRSGSQKEPVVEIYPGDTADEYEKIKELLGSEKASTE
tara:strand:+ start:504 stop:683 length:180 start_codon:yes stop_codon:yes gene_type:complete